MVFPAVHSVAIKCSLLSQIETAINLYEDTKAILSAEIQTAIPLQRYEDNGHLVYKSAIAFKLVKRWQLSAEEIAQELVNYLSVLCAGQRESALESFTVQVIPPGLMMFQLSDLGIATWLQGFSQIRSSYKTQNSIGAQPDYTPAALTPYQTTQKPLNIGSPEKLFHLQYAHARCCSLLRLAAHQGLIKLSDTLVWQVIDPNPIPWLDANQQLWVSHPAERCLIAQLITTVDELSCTEQPNWLKLAESLSETMQKFHSSCRIFGDVYTQNLQLAQARVGLIVLTRSLLEFMLQEQLGILAPTEL